MIQLQHISVAFGGHVLFRDLNWTIRDGARIGLIGPNGAGKTTLLRIVAGRQKIDAGEVACGKTTVGYLEQDVQEATAGETVREAALHAFDDVLDLEAEEERITDALADEDHTSDRYERLLHQMERVHARLHARESHTIRSRTDAVLTGLGFDPDELDRPLATYSGGWRMRAALGKLLLQQPDVLLLDEPTNHLDIDSIDWLENYLKGYPGTVVLVSHDRYFLDRMVTSIAEVDRGHLHEYAGNYSYYLKEREERRELQRAAYENQQRQIKEVERFIERFRYKASKAKQVQSRIKQLEKMERVPPPPDERATIGFRFPEPIRSGRVVMELSEFSKTYPGPEGDVEVFDGTGPLTIERGDKIALIGSNGAGKSTLARIIRGTEPFDGEREMGYRVTTTFFAQHQAEALNPGHTILESLREQAPGQDETTLRTLAGAFLFSGDDVFKKIAVLSGGEKSRVALARTLLQPANFLILDEPTNHLDIQSIDVLVEALEQYQGTFVVVSHDRHFLDRVANRVWRVGDGRVATYPGTYADYRWQLEHGTAQGTVSSDGGTSASATAESSSGSGGPKSKEQKRKEAEARRRLREKVERGEVDDYTLLNGYQLRQLYERAEAAIMDKEEEKAELEAALADPEVYEDGERARETTEAYDTLKQELADLYERWEELAEHVAEREAA